MKITVRKATKNEIEEAKGWPIWEKEPSVFAWSYDEKENCYILEGKAKATTEEEEVEFGKGDYVVFPAGLSCTWEIKEKIRKHYKFG